MKQNNEWLASLYEEQFYLWPKLRAAYDFREVKRKTLQMGDMPVVVQCSPARIVSTGAKVDQTSLARRKCPLCDENRPLEQVYYPLESGYKVLINPFPILPVHLTIVAPSHVPQRFSAEAAVDVLSLDPRLAVFYNGGGAGASSPDHAHLQAVLSSEIPLLGIVAQLHTEPGVCDSRSLGNFPMHFKSYLFESSEEAVEEGLQKLANERGLLDGTTPSLDMVNSFLWLDAAGRLRALVFPRRAHRPACYWREGEERLMVSPGALDMAGIVVLPRSEDFSKITVEDVERVYSEVSDFDGETVRVVFVPDCEVETLQTAEGLLVKGQRVGESFHWEEKRDLLIPGNVALTKLPDGRTHIVAEMGLEEYIAGVVASEMNGDAPLEYLKAHCVIARTWLARKRLLKEIANQDFTNTDSEIIRWEDGSTSSHPDADVCNNDHCQRYYGASVVTPVARQAALETRGEILTDKDGVPLDARYSKCCGGHTEAFSTAWGDRDSDAYRLAEDPYCTDPDAAAFLGKYLNDIDLQTHDWLAWEQRVDKSLVRERIKEILGRDLGDILTIEPLERGFSGRISRMKIKGTKGELIVGKELTIRRLLSENCLKSSAFEVSDEGETLLLRGRGWGHGVGLCQIGAAVMAERGFGYRDILAQYYQGCLKTYRP